MVDVIGIGAINFDFMHFVSGSTVHLPGSAQESLGDETTKLRNKINRTITRDNSYLAQVGGAAYFTIKTIGAIREGIPGFNREQLKLSYVGVCGKFPESDEWKYMWSKFPLVQENEFNFLDNKDWLFFENEIPGISYAVLQNGCRSMSEVAQGVNKYLQRNIIEHEQKTNEKFVDFLSQAKWVHISSLKELDQFLWLADIMAEAKLKNPDLVVSMDPGHRYMKDYLDKIKRAFCVADYVFLSKAELDQITLYKDEEYAAELLDEFFLECGVKKIRLVVTKDTDRFSVISFDGKGSKIDIINFDEYSQIKILNDDGSGSAFAGGFIVGNLVKHKGTDPVKLGAAISCARMISRDLPFETIKNATTRIFNNQTPFPNKCVFNKCELTDEICSSICNNYENTQIISIYRPQWVNLRPSDEELLSGRISEENYCFVLMPYNNEALDDIYQNFIKEKIEEHFDKQKLKCIRADDMYTSDAIIEKISGQIKRCKLIIADITNHNANVFYELGMAHAIGKKCIMISNRQEDKKELPFDIRSLDVLFLEKNTQAGREAFSGSLIKRIESILQF